MLLKGVDDVKDLPRPLAAAEMALVRLAYASDLPTPEEALRKLAEATEGSPRHAPLPPAEAGLAPRSASSPPIPPREPPRATRPDEGGGAAGGDPPCALRGRGRSRSLEARHSARPGAGAGRAGRALRTGQHRLLAGRGRFAWPRPDIGATLAGMDRRALDGGAGARLDRADAARGGEAREAERASGAEAHPLVRKVLERFKGARVVDVRTPDTAAPAPPPPAQADDDVAYADSEPLGDDDL